MPSLHAVKGTARFGSPLSQARAAVILVHGRGSSPHDIAGLADVIPGTGLAFLAPAATGGTWYPQRFFAPLERNEPWLSSALNVIDQLVAEVLAVGIASEQIGLAGFSQGACLVLEYAARHPRRHGFIAGLSGALIGPPDTPRPTGDLRRTPILLGCAELDAHIPVDYVERSAEIFSRLNADVTKQIFPGAAHAIFPAETEWLKQHAPNPAPRKAG
jgi:phospholipase/carboxylesterase